MRKPVIRVSDQVRHKPSYLATKDSWTPEILDIKTKTIILSKVRKTKVSISLRGSSPDLRLFLHIQKAGFLMMQLIEPGQVKPAR